MWIVSFLQRTLQKIDLISYACVLVQQFFSSSFLLSRCKLYSIEINSF